MGESPSKKHCLDLKKMLHRRDEKKQSELFFRRMSEISLLPDNTGELIKGVLIIGGQMDSKWVVSRYSPFGLKDYVTEVSKILENLKGVPAEFSKPPAKLIAAESLKIRIAIIPAYFLRIPRQYRDHSTGDLLIITELNKDTDNYKPMFDSTIKIKEFGYEGAKFHQLLSKGCIYFLILAILACFCEEIPLACGYLRIVMSLVKKLEDNSTLKQTALILESLAAQVAVYCRFFVKFHQGKLDTTLYDHIVNRHALQLNDILLQKPNTGNVSSDELPRYEQEFGKFFEQMSWPTQLHDEETDKEELILELMNWVEGIGGKFNVNERTIKCLVGSESFNEDIDKASDYVKVANYIFPTIAPYIQLFEANKLVAYGLQSNSNELSKGQLKMQSLYDQLKADNHRKTGANFAGTVHRELNRVKIYQALNEHLDVVEFANVAEKEECQMSILRDAKQFAATDDKRSTWVAIAILLYVESITVKLEKDEPMVSTVDIPLREDAFGILHKTGIVDCMDKHKQEYISALEILLTYAQHKFYYIKQKLEHKLTRIARTKTHLLLGLKALLLIGWLECVCNYKKYASPGKGFKADFIKFINLNLEGKDSEIKINAMSLIDRFKKSVKIQNCENCEDIEKKPQRLLLSRKYESIYEYNQNLDRREPYAAVAKHTVDLKDLSLDAPKRVQKFYSESSHLGHYFLHEIEMYQTNERSQLFFAANFLILKMLKEAKRDYTTTLSDAWVGLNNIKRLLSGEFDDPIKNYCEICIYSFWPVSKAGAFTYVSGMIHEERTKKLKKEKKPVGRQRLHLNKKSGK